MKMKNGIYIILALAWLLSGLSFQVWAGDETSAVDIQNMLHERINQARQNPEIAVGLLGLDTDQYRGSYGRSPSYLELGMADLRLNEDLVSSATEIADEMASNARFSKVSLDGFGPLRRIWKSGYRAGLSGEMFSLVFFQNYLSQEKAVEVLYENIIRKEIENESGPVLFDPELRDVGIAVKTGVYQADAASFNFYLAVFDFGSPMVSEKEFGIYSLLNKYRQSPDALEEFLAGDSTEIGRDGLLPMNINAVLSEFADTRTALLVENIIEWLKGNALFEALDPEFLTQELDIAGYHAGASMEKIDFTVSSDGDSDQVYELLFKKMLRNELETNPMNRILLSSACKDIGISLLVVPLVPVDGQDKKYIYVMGVNAAEPL